MIRSGIIIVMFGLVAVVMATSATAAKSCNRHYSVKHSTCKVADRVVDKWVKRDYKRKRFEVRGRYWRCSLIGPPVLYRNPFGCVGPERGYVDGEIHVRR